jgi:hypothetical protein
MSTTIADNPSPSPAEKEENTAYLRSLLNKNLRVTTTDNRMFWGAFKCTDSVSHLHHHHPSPRITM